MPALHEEDWSSNTISSCNVITRENISMPSSITPRCTYTCSARSSGHRQNTSYIVPDQSFLHALFKFTKCETYRSIYDCSVETLLVVAECVRGTGLVSFSILLWPGLELETVL